MKLFLFLVMCALFIPACTAEPPKPEDIPMDSVSADSAVSVNAPSEPAPALPLPVIELDVKDFYHSMKEMEESGKYPDREYAVQLTGLSKPVTLVMRDIYITSVTLNEDTYPLSAPLRTVGPVEFELFEAYGVIVLESAQNRIGDAYLLTDKDMYEFHPDRAASTWFYMNGNSLRYTRTTVLFAQMEQFGALSEATGDNDFFSASGNVTSDSNGIHLSAPDEIVTVGEVYNLYEEFEILWKDRYRNIFDCFSANRKRRADSIGWAAKLYPLQLDSEYDLALWINEAGECHLVRRSDNGDHTSLANLDTVFVNPGNYDTLKLLHAEESKNGWKVWFSHGTGLAYFFEMELKEGNFTGMRLITAEEAIAAGAFTPVPITFTTPEALEEMLREKYISKKLCQFYTDLIRGEGDFAGVKAKNVEISFTVPMFDYESKCRFTVTESALDTLPPGDYEWTVDDVRDIFIRERRFSDTFTDVTEVDKLRYFIAGSFIWNTPTYGKGHAYPGMHNYLCNYYGKGTIPLSEYKRLAEEEFGVTDFDATELHYFIRDGMVESGGIGGVYAMLTEDVKRGDGITTVILQLYADVNYLLKSHKIAYRFGADGQWLGYEILEKSDREPLGLRFAEDT